MKKEIACDSVRLETFAVGDVIYITGTSSKESSTIDIPEEIDGKPLVRVLERAFADCTAVSTIILPKSVTQIGPYAFENCKSITGITLPEKASELEQGVFKDCASLTHVILPNGLKSIPTETFSGCSALKSIRIPDTVTALDEEAFLNCTSLPDFSSPSGLVEFKERAFCGCTAMKVISIPANFKIIGKEAFLGCSALETIIFAGTKEAWASLKKGRGWRDGCPAATVICKDGNLQLKKATDVKAEAGKAAKAIGKGTLAVGKGIGSVISNVADLLFGSSDRAAMTASITVHTIAIASIILNVLNSVFIHTMDTGYDLAFYILCGVCALLGCLFAVYEKAVNGSVSALGKITMISASIAGTAALLKLFHTINFVGVWGLASAGVILFTLCFLILSDCDIESLTITHMFIVTAALIANIVLGIVYGGEYLTTFYIVSGATVALLIGLLIITFNIQLDEEWGWFPGISAGVGAVILFLTFILGEVWMGLVLGIFLGLIAMIIIGIILAIIA